MEKRAEPTDRQRDVLVAIHRHVERVGWAPTLRELGDALGMASTQAVFGHLDLLAKKGLVERGTGGRALRITDAGRRYVRRAA